MDDSHAIPLRHLGDPQALSGNESGRSILVTIYHAVPSFAFKTLHAIPAGVFEDAAVVTIFVTVTCDMALAPIIPHAPDFYVCDRAYGDLILVNDCTAAINKLPNGHETVDYNLNRPNLENSLPFSSTEGTCTINVEHAGPDVGTPQSFELVPDDLRRMAEFVKARCAVHGIGGFTTDGFDSVTNYLAGSGEQDLHFRPDREPSNMWFVTVSITGSSKTKTTMKPGDTDPVVGIILRDYAKDLIDEHNDDTKLKDHFAETYERLLCRSWQMKRGGSLDWWDPRAASPDEMTYACDTSLGSPALVDCAQIQWQGLGPPSDTISIGPGVTKLLSQNTCNLAISATVVLTLTWNQIQTAFSTLINTCIENPAKPSQGGRAYFGPFHALPTRSAKRRRDLTGLDALPPHANLTVFAGKAPSNA